MQRVMTSAILVRDERDEQQIRSILSHILSRLCLPQKSALQVVPPLRVGPCDAGE